MPKAKVEYGRVGATHAKGWARFQDAAFKKYKKAALQIAKQGYCYYVDDVTSEVCKCEVDHIIIDEEQRDIEIRIGSLYVTGWYSNKKEALKIAKN